MSETAYDTAWVARVKDPWAPAAAAFPSALEWLLPRQHPDGSWGGTVPVIHDRVVSTLIAAITLTERPDARYAGAVAQAEAYLARALVRLDQDATETVGFELIMPTLLARAQNLRLSLPYERCASIYDLRADKMRRLPIGFVYSGPSPLTHSLEFLGDEFQPDLARRSQASNGSFAASPSATAYFLIHQWDNLAAAYLRSVLARSATGGACNVFPFEVFEKGWVLSHLGPLAHQVSAYRKRVAELAAAWSPIGVGFTASGIVPDGDDTAIVFRVLRGGGVPVQPDVFRLFEADDYFFTFPLERNQSVSTNAHVLHALRDYGDFPGRERMITKAIAFLSASRLPGGMWRDKWHASAYYATGRVILALEGREDAAARLVGAAVAWLVETQHENGSWSEFDAVGTCEETAYALQALVSVPRLSRAVVAAMHRAARYLWAHIDNRDYPELWVGKGLYAPYAVIRAAILGALYAYQKVEHTLEVAGDA
ncbi:MAG TPA: prenyltransferase/squalene oxidase repeat-containing protein [Chloroflexota bacterium]